MEARDGEGRALYNLKTDIGEKTNLATSEPDKMKQMTAVWSDWNATLMEPKWKQGAKKAGKGKKKMKK